MRKELSVLLLSAIIICGCRKDKPNDSGINPVTPKPSAVTLIFPEENAICTTGTILSAAQSSVIFTWDRAVNATSYSISVKNLLTAALLTQTTTNLNANYTLDRNTPYSWFVTSNTSDKNISAISTTWKFYNSGPGIVTYVPFPAELISPAPNQALTSTTGSINLIWKGSAVDNSTIANYDVYFGSTISPAVIKAAVKDDFLNNISITTGNTYYWRVITRDVYGNTSDSGLAQFQVN